MLVDDHAVVRSGCRRILEPFPDLEVAEAADGPTALAALAAAPADVVVLDLSMPGMGGLEVLRRLRAADDPARVLIFSMHDDPLLAASGLQAGASGYVTKGDAPGELAAAIRRIADGGTYLSREVAQGMAMARTLDEPADRMTPREREIAALLVEGHMLADIAAALSISYKTVANTLVRLRGKLGARSNAGLVRRLMERGPRLNRPEQE
ncbi:DNA-binding response regulator [Zavarzinia compransoris]|uniref:DNA-binding response regulator n=1 Tax=Zavarzinia compransoris TaxID=1264899 RepID=A0A317DXT1_9PROT|nr:DNA-binding response regulator [Zavarzinia compransoris]